MQDGAVGIFEQLGGDDARYYLVCTSGIPALASEVFCAIKSDVGEHCTALEFADSKEAWFLQHLAQRNRLRVLAGVARELGLEVHTRRDCMAHASQKTTPVAVETCGLAVESLAVQEGMQTASVVHCKGCVGLDTARGPLPVWLGAGQDLLIFTPDPVLRCTHLLQNDESQYFAGGSESNPKLLPAENLHEASMKRAQYLQCSAECGGMLSVQDVEYNMAVAPAPELELRDGFGRLLFEARAHEPPLPVVLCPQQPPKYAHVKRASFWQSTSRRNRARQPTRRRRPGTRPLHANTREIGNALFAKREVVGDGPLQDFFGFAESEAREEDSGVVVTWDHALVGIIRMLMSDGAHEMGVTVLCSRACVADVDA